MKSDKANPASPFQNFLEENIVATDKLGKIIERASSFEKLVKRENNRNNIN